MKKKLNRKLRVERETVMVLAGLDHDEAENVRGGALCTRCDTSCISCRCNTLRATCKSG
jgi:hypothetical protein